MGRDLNCLVCEIEEQFISPIGLSERERGERKRERERERETERGGNLKPYDNADT